MFFKKANIELSRNSLSWKYSFQFKAKKKHDNHWAWSNNPFKVFMNGLFEVQWRNDWFDLVDKSC